MNTKFGFLIFSLVLLFKFDELASEPIRRYSYVGPFPRYSNNQPPTQPYYDDYDYDHLNNISLGRILQDDNQLLQQTENMSSQVKSSIANRLMSLASRLQHAASIIMQGESRRRSHRPNSHRNKYGPPPQPPQNGNNYNPYDSPNYNSPKPPNSYSPPLRPADGSSPSRYDSNSPPNGPPNSSPYSPAAYPSNDKDRRNPLDKLPSSPPKPSDVISSDSETDPKSTPKSLSLSDLIPSTPKPLTLGDLLPAAPKSSPESKPSAEYPELLGRSLRKSEELDEKKKQDVGEYRDGFVKRAKRDADGRVHLLHQDPPPERPSFDSVTKEQLVDVSTTVRNGYDDVIKLLKGYLENQPIANRAVLKRSNERAEQLLENIQEAKKIFVQIDDYVSQQFLENELANRTQTDLITYYDKVVRAEKNRISQALTEYDTTLAANYRFPVTSEISTHPPADQASKPTSAPPPASLDDSGSASSAGSLNNGGYIRLARQPARTSVPDYQNDDDRDLNHYVSQRRRAIERERTRRPLTSYNSNSYYNEIPSEEGTLRDDRPELVIRRVYIPPKARSRPTRRHPAPHDRVRPPYEVAVSNKDPIDNDEREYEMIEP